MSVGVNSSIRERLLKDRTALLDLGTRNRLIHIPLRTKNIRAIEVIEESATDFFAALNDGKRFTFQAAKEPAATSDKEGSGQLLAQPAEVRASSEKAKRQGDAKLQTRLTSENLQKRLLDIWYDARTLEEEQGVNILYVGLGLLKWYEDDTSEIERLAPLVLLPVRLDRSSAAERFHIASRGEPPSTNLSLQAKMVGEFGLKIDDFGDEDEVDLAAYFDSVAKTVSQKKRWQVLTDGIVLGFFSFSKFLMYRDLDPDNWPENSSLSDNELISALLGAGFEASEPFIGDFAKIDDAIPVAATHHVIDADSSQTVAIEEVVRGRHLVIKGPPGTGKSQTITNVLAAASAAGKKVLFVAEKMAALDVVHRRLKQAGLSALALELHSSKANKRTVLEELKRTLNQGVPAAPDDTTLIARLTKARDSLNGHADQMHQAHEPSGLTPYRLLGHLVQHRDLGHEAFELEAPETWTAQDLGQRRELITELVERIAADGAPDVHPWRGVGCEALDPSELTTLAKLVAKTAESLTTAITMGDQTSALLSYDAPVTVADLLDRLRWLEALIALPESDRDALTSGVWSDVDEIDEVVAAGERFATMKKAFDAAFLPAAWDAPFAECRAVLVEKGNSIFRIFSGRYRAQLASLRSYLAVPLPEKAPQRIRLVDGLLSAQAARRDFEALHGTGSAAFGKAWRKERSLWPKLKETSAWVRSLNDGAYPSDFRQRAAIFVAIDSHRQMLEAFRRAITEVTSGWGKIDAMLELDLARAFGDGAILEHLNLADLSERLQQWQTQRERITRWIAFRVRTELASDLGMDSLVETVLGGDLLATDLSAAFEKSYFEAMREVIFAQTPALKRFDGEVHDRLVQSFRDGDLGRMDATRRIIAKNHATSLPRQAGGIGALGVLQGEIAKKRKHLPIRQLLDRAGEAIQQIKPIFMMSPLSVAQFLKPGAITFDLLVVDEASQIEPVDALGAIARCRQIVVVGDERQLPPTKFFSKLTDTTDEGDDEEEGTFQAKDAESILDLCLAKGVPHRMLNWHYRSKHQSLIAVSNNQFYDNRLFIVPSPFDAVAGMGLQFTHLPDAHYDRGNTRTNPKEAQRVAKAVIEHARHAPGRSLGVATFSVAQRQAIVQELELLRRDNPDTEEFFSRGTNEPFFVKNLENIQGDERDVIFISIGYGRSSAGYMSMNFGPVTREGGERRLNVLISRAKLQCHVFSSITSADIDLSSAKGRGVPALKMFLEFAQTGRLGTAMPTGNDADSVFEEQVAQRLKALGHDVHLQIGSAGFFVDLAIADKEKPGRFVLGIECDGASYHSSRSARDRDRLRQAVLEEHGWIIHRIWSTDWFLRPEEELAKVQDAIEQAKARWRETDEQGAKGQAVPIRFTFDSDGETETTTAEVGPFEAEEISISVPYAQATLSVDLRREPHEVPPGVMGKHVAKIVEVEGPIHEAEIVARIRDAWGLQRAGNRVREAVQNGIAVAQSQQLIEGDIFYIKPGTVVQIRNRASVTSVSLRRPEMLPPEEVKAAIVTLVRDNFGAEPDALAQQVSRALGFAATSAQLRSLVDECIEELRAAGEIYLTDGRLKIPNGERSTVS